MRSRAATAAAVAALIALAGLGATVVAGCAPDPAPAAAASPPQRPGPAGLRAHLDSVARLTGAARDAALDAWRLPEATWRALVTDAYRDHWADYRDALAARRGDLVRSLGTWRGGATRVQYADDPDLTAEQVRLRWVMPTGRPGAIADGFSVVFFFDGDGWRVLVGLDDVIGARIERAQPRCTGAYLDASAKRCREWAWEIAEGALRDDDGRIRRGCTQAMALGCGGAAPAP